MESSERFECKACGTKFASASSLAEHGKSHAGAETNEHAGHEHFTCNACGTVFHSEAELKEHGKQYHM